MTAKPKSPKTTASSIGKTTAKNTKALQAKAPVKPKQAPAVVKSGKRRTPIAVAPTAVAIAPTVNQNSKQSQLIAKLSTDPGMTIQQMMELTGWQAHTVRGTISGVLRKKLGLNVACASENAGTRVYRIVACAAAA